MASHHLVQRLQQERIQEAAESRLGNAARSGGSGAAIDHLRRVLGGRLIAAGQALGGDATRRPRAANVTTPRANA